MTSRDSLPGRKLNQFMLDELLGQGGMARVYRAWDTRRSVYVAIKVIEKSFRDDTEYSRRFEREAQAISKLRHPNIVWLYEYGNADDVLYMAMQYIQGSDLEHLLANYQAEGETIPAADAIRIIRQICAALDYAHKEGVIHRDVKSSNIMLDEHGNAILTDFGLVLLTEIGTKGEIFGSPHYLAPEQAISSAGVVPQSDLYSLGVILYEMFTGQLPFDADNPMDIAVKHLSETPIAPRQLQPGISSELEAVILKTLSKDPEARYPNGAALANAFEQAMQPRTQTRPATRNTIVERVAFEIAEHPLPPPPAAVSNIPFPTPAVQPAIMPAPPPMPPTQPAMIPRPASRQMSASVTIPAKKSRRAEQGWLVYGALAGVLILVMLAVGGVLLLSGDGNGEKATPDRSIENSAAIDETDEAIEPSTPTLMVMATATATFTATASITPIVTTSVPLTATSMPTLTLAPTLTVASVPPISTVRSYTLTLYWRGEDSLFVVNTSPDGAVFPLAPLQLGDDRGAVDGEDWDVTFLNRGACVTLWKSEGKPKSPDVDCEQVGDELTRRGRDRFWGSAFDVFYDGERIELCESSPCVVQINLNE